MGRLNKKWAILAILWLVWLIYALLWYRPMSVSMESVIPQLDKIAHLGLFFGQFWLLACMINLSFDDKKSWVGLLILAFGLAVVTELAQNFTQTRMMDQWDAVADMIGAILAMLLVSWLRDKGFLKSSKNTHLC